MGQATPRQGLRARLFVPPKLHYRERDRHATWLELFFDLVFVVTISNLGHLLVKDVNPGLIGTFVMLYIPVFWAWVGHTVYASRFDTDDLPYRIITFAMMLGSLGMAVPIAHLSENGLIHFTLGFMITRLCLFLLYLRAWLHLPDARPMTDMYLRTTGLGILLFGLSAFMPPLLKYTLWIVAIAVEVSITWRKTHILEKFPIDPAHLPERLGLFTIIVLGEAVLAMETGLTEVPLMGTWLAAAAMAFLVAACIWWLYFTFVFHAALDRSLGHGLPYLYIHLPLTITITVLAVSMGRLIEEAAHKALKVDTVYMMGAGAALWIACFFTLMWMSDRRHLKGNLIAAFAFAIVATGSLVFFGRSFPPVGVMGALLGIFLTLVILDLRYGLPATQIQQPEADAESPPVPHEEPAPGPEQPAPDEPRRRPPPVGPGGV